ncbi:uncharacterized protein LOC127879189 [Dreissena polymorpha]|uniref:uncharacterized protein LOC127879189 n=1 Tax=Dreissena polymorpha TaxID=45954 RepID=UPI002263C123|nr:uncharacterized protein LOC127879189 [Dreissena polymorpha]
MSLIKKITSDGYKRSRFFRGGGGMSDDDTEILLQPDKASKEEPALANGRSGRKRHYSSPSDDGAPEVVVDTADEPPAKRARLQELSPVSARVRGVLIDYFHWRSNPYVWQREGYRCEQRKSITWGRVPYTWRKDPTPVRPATCYTWKRPDP